MAKYEPRVCVVKHEAIPLLPESMKAASPNGVFYAVEPEQNGKLFISAYANPNGHVCTHVPAASVIMV